MDIPRGAPSLVTSTVGVWPAFAERIFCFTEVPLGSRLLRLADPSSEGRSTRSGGPVGVTDVSCGVLIVDIGQILDDIDDLLNICRLASLEARFER
jgi:hypothetical protein